MLQNPASPTVSNLYERLPVDRSQQQPRIPRNLVTPSSSSTSPGQEQPTGEPLSSEYSVITHQNLDVNSSHSLEDILEESGEVEEVVGNAGIQAGYSVIRHEDIDAFVSEGESEGEEQGEELKEEGTREVTVVSEEEIMSEGEREEEEEDTNLVMSEGESDTSRARIPTPPN